MAVFRCKMCGGQLEITEGASICTCDYCGTEQTLPRLDNEKKTTLYDRANHFRRSNDYDKAMNIYEQILNEDSSDAEAYWSLVLCKYGIEYVEDPATHKRIPTVNRVQYTSVYADENYKSAIANADAMQKNIYEQEAKAIDEIQRRILAISEKEEPFDIFICYKETDENGRRTPDSVLANDLYYQLMQEGFKVFFARITLEDKLGQEYEPYIFAALNSAKVMVVLGTKPQHFSAIWVKNEWSRYLSLISAGAKKVLIPAYRDMDPYDLPEEFSHLQAQDMSKLGFMQDLIRGIKKILDVDKTPQVTRETVTIAQAASNVPMLLKRGRIALEDGDYAKADGFYEEVLNQNAECGEAYLGKLLSKNSCASISGLAQSYLTGTPSEERTEACAEDTDRIERAIHAYTPSGILTKEEIQKIYAFDRSYQSVLPYWEKQKEYALSRLSEEKLLNRAKQYAGAELKQEIEEGFADAGAYFDEQIHKVQKDEEEEVLSIKAAYGKHCKEADEKTEKLFEERQESRYREAMDILTVGKSVTSLEKAVSLFQSISGYKDSEEKTNECQEKIKGIKKKARQDKKRKIIAGIIVTATVLAVAFGWLLVTVIIPGNKYKEAVSLKDAGEYDRAEEIFSELGDYEDSMIQVQEVKYSKACSLRDGGKVDEALALYDELKDYKDSVEQVKMLKYSQACSLRNGGKYDEAIEILLELGNYKDSALQVREVKYIKACNLLSDKNIEEALIIFAELGDYKDSLEKSQEVKYDKACTLRDAGNDKEALALFKEVGVYQDAREQTYNLASIGDVVELGDYNGFKEWIVLDKSEDKLLLMSRKEIDKKCFSKKVYDGKITWEKSDVRKWLNETFYYDGFTMEERKIILTSQITNNAVGADTEDRVFLLSCDEVNKYLTDENESIELIKTSYEDLDKEWLTRSPDPDNVGQKYEKMVFTVHASDGISTKERDALIGIRPVLWLDISQP